MQSEYSAKDFTSLKNIAVVGVSRNPRKFGNTIYKELKGKGYNVLPVNYNLDEYDGVKCFKQITDLPDEVEGIIMNVPSDKVKVVLEEAKSRGIKNIWLQQGSGNRELVDYCKAHKMNVVNNECILMYAEPVTSFHKFHRWIWKLIGKYPN